MTVNRRGLLAAGLGLSSAGLGARVAAAAGDGHAMAATSELHAAPAPTGKALDPQRAVTSADTGLTPDAPDDQSLALQAAIDQAAQSRVPLILSPGRYRAANIRLRPGLILAGSGGAATLALSRPGAPLLSGEKTDGLVLRDLRLDGAMQAIAGKANALVELQASAHILIDRLHVAASGGRGLALDGCGGRVHLSRFATVADAAIFSIDSTGLDITDNDIADCGNNGIQVWRSQAGEDGSVVARNRIAQIAARSGGSGQNGNGINVFRAGGVIVEANRIADCAYSAIRGNAASNIQIVANACQRLGEVAIYAEFGFQGALIAGNVIDEAAAGITVTNFNEGGRLAVIQGNLVRNLKRREHEPMDKRGEGITVEADATVTGNTIENAPTAGIMIGWGRYMRDVIATGNLIRGAPVGIAISSDPQAGSCLVTANMISGTSVGAIRAMDKGRVHGPDLAREVIATTGRVVVRDNMAV